MAEFARLALAISDSDKAQAVAADYRALGGWVPLERADAVVVVGGDGFMLQTLHAMLDAGRVLPVYGVNLGTVGFLMNRQRPLDKLLARIARANPHTIAPLAMEARARDGTCYEYRAINEVSLLRETRQTAKLRITVNDKVRIDELVCDGVLVSTPAGSTAYNLSASGPILPLDSNLLALTPISPFRPRRWRGAVLPDRYCIEVTVNEPDKRPVSVGADQKEVRDVEQVVIRVAQDSALTLLFDPGHSLDERSVAEQFQV